MSTPTRPPSPVSNSTDANGGYIETLQAPVSGKITSLFGARSAPIAGASTNHKGIDISVPQGTPVKAAASGVVEFAGLAGGLGQEVKIRHDDSTETVYGHLSQLGVVAGQQVVAGQIIGNSGGTPGTFGAGTSTGAHLHYEVIKNNQQVNPLATTIGINSKQPSQIVPDATTINPKEGSNRATILNYYQDDVIKSLISGDHFKDNPVNDYDNLTYHWRFFMTSDQEVVDASANNASTLSSFYEKLASLEQVTIAESGVTAFSIDEVTMQSVVGTDFQVESTKFTSIEMKITEPNGVNFLDALRNAGIKLGVRNYQKCFYYIELSFKGYNEDGTINLKPFDGAIPNGGRWLWTVNLSDIQVNLSAGGGSYILTMTPLNDTMLTGVYNLVPSTVHPSGATVGEFFDNFCTQLNNIWSKIKGDPGIIKYSAKFHPVKDLLTEQEVRTMSVKPKDEDLNPIQGFEFIKNTNTAYISPGFTISNVLDSLMKSCEQAQNLAKDASVDVQQVNDSGNKVNANGYRQSVLWRIEPEVHNPDYDPIYNEYYQHITLHIYGFRNHAAVLAPQDTLSEPDTQKAILTDMAQRGFLPKKYEYLFTGLNSEVIDLDLNFNLKWQALLPTLASNTQEQVTPQARVNPQATPRENALTQQGQREQQAQQVASIQQIAANQAQTGNDEAQAFNKLEEAEKEYAKTGSDEAREARDKARQEYNGIKAVNRSQNQITHETRAQLKAARAPTTPQTGMGRTFGEDLTQTGADLNLDKTRQNELFPITVQTFNPTDADGLEGQFHNGKSIYGAVLNQVYGPLASQFFRISMTINGDPFWIGAGSFEEAIYRRTDTFDINCPNFPEGVNCFLFKMKYPLGQDDDGNVILNTNETVTGVYQVNKITHRFVEGKFTQILEAYRVAIVDLYKSIYSSLYKNPDEATDPKNQQTQGGTT